MAIAREDLQAALEDRYEVRRELGRGGMAVVFEAWDTERGGPVALKVLHPELAATVGGDRFLREAQIAARLSHPHIVPVLHSDHADGFVYYAMQVVEGESLQDRLDREGQLPVDEALEITRQVASALDYAHAQGVVHRDIKPGNILLSEGGAVVTDFGIAKAVDDAGERLTETGLAMGTPAYMSPEQAEHGRRLDGRADQYSLACVLYEMLAGHPPFPGSTAQVILSRHSKDPVPSLGTARSTVTGPIESVIAKALEKAPPDRFRSAGKFADALYMARQGVTPPDVTPITGTQPMPAGIWGELARRRVYQVAGSYIVMAFGLVEILANLDVGVPAGFQRWVQWTAIAGFPVAVLLAWAFELTPKGLRRTAAVGVTPSTGVQRLRPWHRLAMTAAVLAVGGIGLLLSIGTTPAAHVDGGPAVGAATDLDPRRVFVEPFENLTRDASLDYVGRDLAAGIVQGIDRIDSVSAAPLTTPVASAAVAAGGRGAGSSVTGRFDLVGDEIRVTAELIEVRSGITLKTVGPYAGPRGEPGVVVEETVSRMMSTIALELGGTASAHPELRTIRPPRFDALRLWLAGLDAFTVNGDHAGALALYRDALDRDTGFVEAGFFAWGMLRTGGADMAALDSAATWVRARIQELSPLSQAGVTFWTEGWNNRSGDVEERLLEDLVRATATREDPYGGNEEMVIQVALRRNRLEKVMRIYRERNVSERGREFWRWNIARIALHLLGRHDEELEATRDGMEGMRDTPTEGLYRVFSAGAQVGSGEPEQAEITLDQFLTSTPRAGGPQGGWPAPCAYGFLGREMLAHDYQQRGRELLRRAADWFEDPGQEGVDATCDSFVSRQDVHARVLYEAGELDAALPRFRDLALAPPNDGINDEQVRHLNLTYWGRAAARLEDEAGFARVEALLDEVPEELRYQHYYYGRAAMAELAGLRDRAVEFLTIAERTGEAVNKIDLSLAYVVHTDPDFADLRRDARVRRLLAPK